VKNKKLYNSIFISDLHLGTNLAKTEELLNFLGKVKCRHLYLVGDIVDFLHLYDHHGWSRNCNLVIRKILSKVRKGCMVKICIGNHDAFLGIVAGFKFGNIEIDYEFEHVAADGKKYLVLHGDDFDHSLKLSLLAKAVSFLYNHWHWLPLINKAKIFVDKMVERQMDVDGMVEYARNKGIGGVIFGHIHNPYICGDIINCGDWVGHCTAVVEELKGEMSIVDFSGEKID
jgi:UDP-2,3-diacylglucosamine pyrophosphatase LpxH